MGNMQSIWYIFETKGGITNNLNLGLVYIKT